MAEIEKVEQEIQTLRERLEALENRGNLNPITISAAVLSGSTVQMTGLTLTGSTDYAAGSSPAPPPAATAESYPWAWSMNYYDTKKYTSRVVAAGYHGSLKLCTTQWPPNYKVPNGQPGGGYPPSGSKPTGNEAIRLCPPVSGTGRIMFVTHCHMTIVNNSNQAGQASFGLGVSYVNGPNKPMYPYLGVAHALEVLDDSTKPITIPANSAVNVVHPTRMDLMDNAFQGDQPIPNWPNWKLQLATDGSQMYPAVTPMIHNMGGVPLTVMDIYGFGYVC
jgi:hypothetical protein